VGTEADATEALGGARQTLPRLYRLQITHTLRVLETRRQKHLVLILAREFASNLATPALIADAEGTLVYYNEAAEEVAGRPFAEVGEIPVDDWTSAFEPRTDASEPLPPEQRPTRIALDERRAVHQTFTVTSADGVVRDVAVTAIPLFAHANDFVGIVAIFWRE
jgi:PAS domain-containing protein